MEYENMRMPELKSFARDRGLRNYSRMTMLSWLLCFRIILHQARVMQVHLQPPAPGLLHHLHQLKLENL